MRVVNQSRGVVLVQEGKMAKSLLARARGLLGHAPLSAGEGLLIVPCQSIHTFFMTFDIDVAFLDRQGRIVRTISSMRPWRLSPHLFRAHSVLELPAGTLELTDTRAGDLLVIQG